MHRFLIVQSTYSAVECGLFEEERLIENFTIDKMRASKYLVPRIHEMLRAHSWSLQALSFIGVNQGPGPFTTLRVVIATVNGLGYAGNIPLIGVDAFDALIESYAPIEQPLVVFLNAFSHDIYYAIAMPGVSEIEKGYRNGQQLIATIADRFGQAPIRMIGNGVQLYENQIQEAGIVRIENDVQIHDYATLEQIARSAFEHWKKGDAEQKHQLMPLYLKQAFYSPSPDNS